MLRAARVLEACAGMRMRRSSQSIMLQSMRATSSGRMPANRPSAIGGSASEPAAASNAPDSSTVRNSTAVSERGFLNRNAASSGLSRARTGGLSAQLSMAPMWRAAVAADTGEA